MATTHGKDEVLPRPQGSIVLGGTVHRAIKSRRAASANYHQLGFPGQLLC